LNCYGAHKRVVWICLFRISARTSTNVLSDGTLRQQTESRLHRTVCRGGRLVGSVRRYGHKESSGCKGPNRAGDGLPWTTKSTRTWLSLPAILPGTHSLYSVRRSVGGAHCHSRTCGGAATSAGAPGFQVRQAVRSQTSQIVFCMP